MCGIAGAFAFADRASPIDVRVIERLNEQQRRRGPDGGGIWTSEDRRVCFGHRRLAIIDTGADGAQPMTDASGRWVVTFNGEIYNYRELRRELEARGRKFLTHSDTEVLINCVAEWGEAGLRKLRGMYAFGLWDKKGRELWLARDSFGIKPVYWACAGGSLYFASRARALAECAPVDTARNPAGLVGFYLWGFVPEPFTWWEGVHLLPAGAMLRIRFGMDAAPAPTYFAPARDAFRSPAPGPLGQEELRAALVDSIEHHFVSDVPVGVFLSAGIDSTVVAALASQSGYKLRTVTLAFEEFAGALHDEAPLAAETARLVGADHTTVYISRNEFFALLENFLADMDQPTTNGLNSYLVSRAAASTGLKVALSGLGGDELFGGYPSFAEIPRALRLFDIPGRRGIGKIAQSIGTPLCRAMGVSPKYAAAMNYCTGIESAYLLRRCLNMPEELERLLDESWRRVGMERLANASSDGPVADLSEHAQISRLEIECYMRNQPLRDADWAGMAHSIEVRVPLLDMPLFSRVAPAINSPWPPSKADLARCAGSIGRRLLERPKTGFTTPIASWIERASARDRSMKSWASTVASYFRMAVEKPTLPPASSRAPLRAMQVLMLLTDGFGGFGGIAKFNRDFLDAMSMSPLVDRVQAWPRLISEPIVGLSPEAVVYRREFAGSRLTFARRALANSFRGPAFDLVVCGHVNLLPIAWLVARLRGATLALVVHGIEAWRPTRSPLINAFAARVDMLLSVSELTAARFGKWSGVTEERWTILPNSVDTSRFTPKGKPASLLRRYGLDGRRVIMTMGRMAPEERYKGFDEVLEALPELVRRFPDLTYLLVGDGPDRARLEAKAEELSLRDSVIFTGRAPESEKADYFRLADAYVMPSTGEGFGIVFIEAAACGIPVVGGNVDGSREALLQGQLGVLVDPRSTEEIVDAVSTALREKRRVVRNELVEGFSVEAFNARVGAWLGTVREARSDR